MNYKQKVPLICFVVLTVIITLAMAVVDIQTYVNYLNAKDAIKVYQEEIVTNSRKTPSYHDENKKVIQKYTEELKDIISRFKLQHGKPHRKALIAFAKEIGFTEERLMKSFRTYYDALPDEKKGTFTDKKDKAIWEGFMKRLYWPIVKENNDAENKNENWPTAADVPFDPETMKFLDSGEGLSEDDKKAYNTERQAIYKKRKETVDKAFEKFAEYTKQYAEYQIPKTEYKCFLDALGLPVTGELSDLNDLLTNRKYWNDVIPGLDDSAEGKDTNSNSNSKSNADSEKILRTLLVSMDLQSLNENQLSLIYLQVQIKQDLYKRMKKAKITKVHSVLLDSNSQVSGDSLFGNLGGNTKAPQADPLKGNPLLGNAFVTYTYKMKFSGTIESIRSFLDSLNDAYKDYRTYNVRDLNITRELSTEKFPDVLTKTDNSSKRDGMEVPDSYGKVLIGKDLNAECELLVDYVIYVQDQISRQQAK